MTAEPRHYAPDEPIPTYAGDHVDHVQLGEWVYFEVSPAVGVVGGRLLDAVQLMPGSQWHQRDHMYTVRENSDQAWHGLRVYSAGQLSAMMD